MSISIKSENVKSMIFLILFITFVLSGALIPVYFFHKHRSGLAKTPASNKVSDISANQDSLRIKIQINKDSIKADKYFLDSQTEYDFFLINSEESNCLGFENTNYGYTIELRNKETSFPITFALPGKYKFKCIGSERTIEFEVK